MPPRAARGARPIRVRAVYTRYPHWGAHSGINQLFRHLNPTRCTVETHAASDSDEDLPMPFAAVRARLKARVARGGMEWYKLSDLAAELRALPDCLLGRADVVHFADGEHSAQYLPRWLRRSRVARTKVMATYHQVPALLARLLTRDVIAALDHVTLVSSAQRPFFRDLLPPERIQVIPHGIDTAFFRPGATPRDGSTFSTITTGHWRRDWLAVRAVAQRLASAPSFTFHVVTNRETGLDDLANVRLHRNVSDATLLALYQAADCLFLPLLDATANNSLLEGIACGLPVVSTKLEAIEDYVPGDEAILVPCNDPDEIVHALSRLRDDPALRAAMGTRARARAEELSWSRVAREYERLYARLAGVDARQP
jgi:glycosyltransferase involved in cell wall biosynthesis